jgi:hypothetical protein
VKGRIPQKLLLVRGITKVEGNTVEGVKFTYFMKAHFVIAAECH